MIESESYIFRIDLEPEDVDHQHRIVIPVFFPLVYEPVTERFDVAVFFINALFKRSVIDSLLFSVALAVGLTPGLLPVILSINLSRGANAMSKKGVIVKRLAAIQNFGSMDVLCCDKTGTLTENRVTLIRHVDIECRRQHMARLHGADRH